MNTYCIYVHTNKINGKKYVGLTSSPDPNRRWGNGKGYGKKQPVFHAAIQKYGWENFDHEVLLTGLTRYMACKMESYYIEKLETFIGEHPDKGYNMTKGGEGADKGKNSGSNEYKNGINKKLQASGYKNKWYHENKENDDAKHKAWREANPERAREQRRRWEKNNPDKRKTSQDKWLEKNKEKHDNYMKEYRKRWKEAHPNYWKERVKNR